MAKAAELDTDLITGLKAAKSKRAYFAIVLKGSNDGALIVSKTKVPPAAITEAKKRSGGSAVLKGFCQYEEGTYVFETAKQAPATASQAVKLIAKRDAGLAVKAEFRVSADPELLADEGDASAATPPPAPPVATPPGTPQADGASVVKRLNAMTADIKAGLAGPNKDRVKTLFAEVNGQLQSKDFAQASKTLDELGPLLAKQSAGDAANTDAASPPDGAAVTKRLNALTPDIKTALAGPNKDRVKTLFVAVGNQLKSKDFAQAGKTLDELEPLIKQKTDAGAAMSAWQAARKTAVAKLNAIAAKIAKSKNPKAGKAQMMVKAVAANLPAELATPQKIAETVQYLKKDEVVLDVCQFAEDIRTPLLGILARMKA